MGAEDINIALDKQELKRGKLKRCLLCTKERDYLFFQVVKVNQAILNILLENAKEKEDITILNQTNHIPILDGVIDDLTLKPIDGMGYQVSVGMCKNCLEKTAWRHKYKKKNPFVTA